MANEEGLPPQQDWRPRPDPTALTTEAIRRDIEGLRNLLLDKIKGEETIRMEQIARLHSHMDHVEDGRREQKTDTEKAIAAALTAQKEAVEKSEVQTSKLLEGIRRELGDLKDRVGIIEARALGAEDRQEALSTSTGLAIAAISVIVAICAVVVAVVMSGG